MPLYVKSHALFLFGVFAALLIAGAQRASAADGCSAASLKVARGFDVEATAAADFNGDGRPDLVAADGGRDAVAVLLNDGTGWFAAPSRFGAGTRPSAVAVADLNGDAHPDLAVTNSGSNNVSILLGVGGGVFGPPSNFAVGADPRAVAVGDFNGDGKADLAVGNVEGRSVSVLLGDGTGAFSPAAASPITVAGQPIAVAVADFNSDGKRDLAVATFSGFFMLAGNGTGGFSAPSQVFAAGGTAVAATDLNGDGKADLVLGVSGGMAVLLGDGAGGFSAPTVFKREGGGSVNSLALGDLDDDGKQDIAVSGSPAGVTFFKSDGAGGFSQTKSYLARNNPSAVVVGDFDGDGKQDIAAGGSILLNAGGGVFETARAVYSLSDVIGFTSATPFDLALGDFNADGRADMAVLHRPQIGPDTQAARVAILLADSSGGFTPASSIVFFSGSSLSQVIAADFNKDGKADVAVAATISQPFAHVVSVSLSNGDGTFAAPKNVNISFAAQQPSSLDAGDFNNDGNLDIIVISRLTQNFVTLFGDGAGNFSFGGGLTLGTSFDRVAVGDFNNDSKQDFVVTDSNHQRVLVLLGNGMGAFGAAQPFSVGGIPSAVAIGDFNLDGKRDIAVSNHAASGGSAFIDDGSVSVLLGNGTGGFAPVVNYMVGVFPEDVVAGDFDGDGKPDLAVANLQSSTISLLSGDGTGAFSPAANFEISGGPSALAAHDFDGDGRADVAATLPGSRAAGVLFGEPASPQPCLFADDVSVTEGDAGTSDAEVIVRMSGASTQVVKVNYAVRGFPATEGQDFAGVAGTITFQPGETSKVVNVPVIGDTLNEDDEWFTFHLSGALNARISDGIAKINISDNDPPPSISISDVAVAEKDSTFDTAPAVFTVTLSGPSSKTVNVDFISSNGTATANSDYDAAQGTLSFLPGVTSKTITVNVRGDLTREPDETFFINLSNPSNATVARGQGQGTILNNDPVPAVTVFDASISELTGADNTMTVTLRLSNPTSLPVTVDFATADGGTATAGSDYLAAAGTVTFNPGDTQKTFTVTVKDDALDELHETFFVNLSNPSNATIARGQALCTIFDNDGPTISINDVTVTEGQSGRTNANFTFTLSAPSPQAVSVRAATANGTANANNFPADYQGFSIRFVTIPAGSTTATLTVSVNGDLIIEPDETFFVNLSQPQDCTIADAQGLGTIVNDDTTSVQFSTDALTVNEADGSVQVTVNRVGDLSGVFNAVYETFNGTASERSDYTASLGTLRFEPNETNKTITVLITDDALVENPENFFIALGGPNGAPTNPPSVVNITVNSDDATDGPNPLGPSSFFVRQHYRDFLGRDPDPSGLQFWTNEIESCGSNSQCREVKRINVSAAFFLSIEFQETGYLVYRLYKAAYGDATSPNVPGTVPIVRLNEFLPDTRRIGEGVIVNVGDWQTQLENNKQSFALEFVGRARFLSAYPSTLTADEFVNKLDQNAGGVLSSDERTQLVSELGATPADAAKRAGVLRKVAEDADLRRREFNRAFVLMQFYGYLRRNPNDPQDTDFRGWKFWLDKLNQFNGNFVQAEMVKAFLSSIEYRQRFGQP